MCGFKLGNARLNADYWLAGLHLIPFFGLKFGKRFGETNYEDTGGGCG